LLIFEVNSTFNKHRKGCAVVKYVTYTWLSLSTVCCVLVSIDYVLNHPTIGDNERESRVYNSIISIKTGNEMRTYEVEIEEIDRGLRNSRIVHLYPDGGKIFNFISGHDDNCDGRWDRIFYCGYDSEGHLLDTGANYVSYTKSGVWEFHPCPADKGRIQPFTVSEIVFAINCLDQAVLECRHPKNLVSFHIWNGGRCEAAQL
jgi:hypothetical protein